MLPSNDALKGADTWPFSSGSTDGVIVSTSLEVIHDEILGFITGTDVPADHNT